MLARNVADEVARNGVQVNAVGTNFMDFPEFLRGQRRRPIPTVRAKIEAQVPLGRLGTMEEFAVVLHALHRRLEPVHDRPVRRLRRRLGLTTRPAAWHDGACLARPGTPVTAPSRLAPSLLAADFGHLADAVAALEGSGAERLHVDVMDGVFVPNFTFGTDTVRALRRETDLPLELHLMITEPDRHLETFAEAGADGITVHYEACPHLHRTLTQIRELDCRSGAAINPSTPASNLDDVLEVCDLALVMTIDPGFGGQKLIPRTLTKVERVRAEIERQGLPTELEVDGGVDASNARACVEAGANVLVAGTAVFGHASRPRRRWPGRARRGGRSCLGRPHPFPPVRLPSPRSTRDQADSRRRLTGDLRPWPPGRRRRSISP